MADRSPLFLLLIFWTLSTGVFGETHVFSSSGETVYLPCRNTDQHCRTSGTTWTYSRDRQTATVAMFTLGEKKRNSERLNLGSDCSLIISRVTTEDAGIYICQQWSGRGGHQYGADSRVFLLVVAVSPSSSSSSSSSSDIGPGLSLTLSCRLVLYSGFSCDGLFSSEDLHLSWVNEAGVDLNTDSRYQISSTGCIISLSTTLISEDEDKQWRCGVYQRNQLKTSDTFTVHYSAEAKTKTTTTTTTTTAAAAAATTTTTTKTPDHNKNKKSKNPRASSPAPDSKTKAELKPQTETSAETPKAEAQTAAAAVTPDHNTNTTTQAAGSSSAVLSVLLSAAALAVFIAAVLCLIQRRRRAAAHQRASGESAVKDENQVHYQTIYMSINPAARAHEQTEDSVTYSEVTCAGKKPEKSASDDDGNDSVTYAAVSRRA
nr:uncharacterized protein DDB_G0271670 [Danio rerio]|eukprot:XP_017210367.1 uncharacterized protein DDB_G0271670 [Danio rerio]